MNRNLYTIPAVWFLAWLGPTSASAQTGTNAFAARPLITLAGGAAAVTGNNAGATAEAGEPDHLGDPAVRSIWWRWTAPANGLTQIDTIGTTLNVRLSVYTGTTVASLALVAANQGADEAPDFESIVRFEAVAGTSYALCADGYTDPDTGVTETGPIAMTVRQPGPGTRPINDLFAAAIVLPGAATVTANGTIVGASVEMGEPDPEASFVPLGPARTVWYSWTAPSSGFFTLRIESDEFIFWEPVAAVYTGASLAGLTLVDQAEVLSFGPGDTESGLVSATFAAAAGQTYRIQVGGLAYFTSSGPFDLAIAPATRPAQDDFAEAADAGTSLVYAAESSLLEATFQAGEPNHFLAIGAVSSISSASVWWKWTAPSSGTVTADTRGSDGDTVLAVYRAGALPHTFGGLVVLGANDDINYDSNALSSAQSFNATAGSVYYFAVTGYSQSSRVQFHLATGERRTPYAAWLLGYPELTGAASAREADPDRDSLSNLQELFHGTNPLVPSQSLAEESILLPEMFIEGSNLVLECGVSNDNLIGLSNGLGAGGVPLAVEGQASTDLKAWSPVPAGDVGLGITFGSMSIPLGGGPGRWMRFKVTDSNP